MGKAGRADAADQQNGQQKQRPAQPGRVQRVQRTLLQTILDKLLADQEHVQQTAEALVAAADTDLTAQDLMYFG